MNGFARACPYTGKLFPVQNSVDDRGLSHIRTAGKGDLRQAAVDELLRIRRRTNKICAAQIQIRHGYCLRLPEGTVIR